MVGQTSPQFCTPCVPKKLSFCEISNNHTDWDREFFSRWSCFLFQHLLFQAIGNDQEYNWYFSDNCKRLTWAQLAAIGQEELRARAEYKLQLLTRSNGCEMHMKSQSDLSKMLGLIGRKYP